MSSNCELLSLQAGILHGGWLQGGPHKQQNYKIGGWTHARGWVLALHSTALRKLSHVSNFLKQNQVSGSLNAKFHVPKTYRKVFLPNFILLQELGYFRVGQAHVHSDI